MIPILDRKWSRKKGKEWHGEWNGLDRELMRRTLSFVKITLNHGSQQVSASLKVSRKTEFCFLERCYEFSTFNYRIQSSKTNLEGILNWLCPGARFFEPCVCLPESSCSNTHVSRLFVSFRGFAVTQEHICIFNTCMLSTKCPWIEQGHPTIIFGKICVRESQTVLRISVLRWQTATDFFTKTSPKRAATRKK